MGWRLGKLDPPAKELSTVPDGWGEFANSISIGTENRRKSRKAGVPDMVMPNQQRPPALESAVLPRLSEPLSPRPYLALIAER